MWSTEAWSWSSAVTLVVVTSLVTLTPLALANLLCVLLTATTFALVILIPVVSWALTTILSVEARA